MHCVGERSLGGHLPCVLVIDDDPKLQDVVTEFFQRNDIRVRTGSGMQDVARHLAAADVNLIILDLRLGHENGLDLLRGIRSQSEVPVIITTGHRRDEVDRVLGLELGADDYVTKPFSLHELLARTRAVLRRARPRVERGAERGAERRHYRFAGWHVDRRTRRLTDPHGNPVPLTKGEYALLAAFLDAPMRPLTREHLLQATRVHEDVFDRSIDVQILRLRRKLESEPNAPNLIKTERGIGYLFAAAVDTS